MVLWPRLLDEENAQHAWNELEHADLQKVRHRVGHLQLFNPMAPDGVYQLNLAEREQHIVAQMCVQLSVMEPGDNCIDEFYGDRPETMKPFATPRSWLDSVPTTGVWRFTYASPTDGCDWKLRRQLSVDYLGK